MSPDEFVLTALAEAIEKEHLDALLVGAAAALLQGAPVMTQDVDFLLRDTPRNREKLERFSAHIGAARPSLVSPLSTAVTLMGGPIPIDVLFDSLPGGLSFASLKSRSQLHVFGPYQLRVASLADVIASKEAADRPKDRAVLPILRETLRVRRELARDGE